VPDTVKEGGVPLAQVIPPGNVIEALPPFVISSTKVATLPLEGTFVTENVVFPVTVLVKKLPLSRLIVLVPDPEPSAELV
jgi:hypothetical protein